MTCKNQQACEMQIRLLREILEWGEGMEASMEALKTQPRQPTLGQVMQEALERGPGPEQAERIIVLVFPEGDFKIVPKGTTAANIIQEKVRLKHCLSSG